MAQADPTTPGTETHAHKRKQQPQLPRDRRGWQVAPAPDGRGTPPSSQRPAHRTRAFLWFAVGLLALNLLSVVFFGPSGEPRVTVPFSPFFVSQVEAGRVK